MTVYCVMSGESRTDLDHVVYASTSKADAEKFAYKNEFYNSSVYLCNRSINLLKTKNKNNYEISSELYSKGRTRNHYGKTALEGFLANTVLQSI